MPAPAPAVRARRAPFAGAVRHSETARSPPPVVPVLLRSCTMVRNWWRKLVNARPRSERRGVRPKKPARHARLRLEGLETRLPPAIDVTAFDPVGGTITFTGDQAATTFDNLVLGAVETPAGSGN